MESLVDFLIRNQGYYLTPLAALGLFLLWIVVGVLLDGSSEGKTTARSKARWDHGARRGAGSGTYYANRSGRASEERPYSFESNDDDDAGGASPGRLPALRFALYALVTLGAIWLGWRLFAGPGVITPTAALDAPTVEVADASSTKLIVLVHGWNGDAASTWQALPDLIKGDQAFRTFDRWVINYPTFQLRRNLSISQMAKWLNEVMVRDGYYQKYQDIHVVAHSMGGLIAREMLLENRLARDNKAYKSLIEIATPHQGADLGRLLASLGLSSGFSDDLSPGSSMLLALRDKWNSLKDRPKTYCLTSPQDSVVPVDSAIFQCDEYLRYPQWGHTEMVKPSSASDDRYLVPVARIRQVEKDLAAQPKDQ